MHSVVLFSDDEGARRKILQGLDTRLFCLAGQYPMQTNVSSILGATKDEVCVVHNHKPNPAVLNQLQRVSQTKPMPIVMFAGQADSKIIDNIIEAGVSAFVVDGLQAHRVTPILNTAIARFNKFNALRDELIKAKLSLEERKYVDRAKSMMVRIKGYTENDAHHALRKMAMENNKRIGQVAKDVINVLEVLSQEPSE